MSCLRHYLKRRRLLRLSFLWIAVVASYFVLSLIFPPDWRSSISNDVSLPVKGFAPFLPNHTKSIVVLAYQRGGSTLFANMFNTNPDVFYMFEPLDGLYSDMYGTSRGWNVPSEITNYWNGTERNLPSYEIREIALFLKHIFQCDVSKLPTSYLVHPYYFLYPTEYRVLEEYIACVDSVDRSLTLCDDPKQDLEVFCGSRFGEQSEGVLVQCYRALWRGFFNGSRAAGRLRQAVLKHNACNVRLRGKLDDTCSPTMQNACSSRRVRAVKCVRATMDSMEPLLAELPNVRVVHLMRDPRGVVLSRMKFHDSTRNRYSDGGNDSMAREAELYCRTAAKDARKRIALERLHPGKIVSIFYEDFVTDIEGYTEKIYQFLELEMPNSTTSWAAEASKGRDGKNAIAIANTWQEELTYRDSSSIVRRCREFFRLSRWVTPLLPNSAGVTADVNRHERSLDLDKMRRQKDALSSNNVV